MNEYNFEEWYDLLQELALQHGESVADQDAWREDFEKGLSPDESFYSEYPEHKES